MNTNNIPLIKSTGQAWKYSASKILSFVSFILVISAIATYSANQWQYNLLVYIGGFSAFIGLTIPMFIKCPKCKTRWYWNALKQRVGSKSLKNFQTQTACPICGFTNDQVT